MRLMPNVKTSLTAQQSNVLTSGWGSCDDLLPMADRDTTWNAMLGKGERNATEEEIAALEAEHGPFLPVDGEG
jgi:hypothetical protein